ncbi:helix-turn-helix domain-containing protein [Zobellia barbeyronii]|uniref:Helix-turn-helix domain-containing protein n=1 Tax=Zobellia barbeyronii TaxID=2748009 RepID=A0ABS5WB42_9FLAO|nr:helix-turn-helix domain-containing protein [Zobellia barbeyronii]MBT2160614.1 helix-turn-helix domain-containing protein [Zobellia barbeyronii]
MIDFKNLKFINKSRPGSGFELIRLEELMSRRLKQDITLLHRVEFYQIIVITEGYGKHTVDFTDYEYSKQTLITIRKNQLQRFFKGSNSKGYLLLFTENFVASLLSQKEVARCHELFNKFLTSPKITLDDEDYKSVISLINHIEIEYIRNYDEFSCGIIRNELHILVYRLLRIKLKQGASFSEHKYFEEFLNFQRLIEHHCFKTKKTLDYAKLMGCTSKTLNNICKAIVHKSSKSVIDEVVITQIKCLLINTSMSITEIAYTSGFDEPTNMYKYFKKHANFTPETFRRSHL